MAAAAVDTPLAAAWSALWSAGDQDELEIARAFAALGEERAVRMALAAKSHHSRGFAAMADDPIFPDSMRFLICKSGRRTRPPPLVAARSPATPGDPQIATVTGRQASPAERAAWLGEAAPAAPLRALCAVICPEDPPAASDGSVVCFELRPRPRGGIRQPG